jgi:hypothetical protein
MLERRIEKGRMQRSTSLMKGLMLILVDNVIIMENKRIYRQIKFESISYSHQHRDEALRNPDAHFDSFQ